jgi:hypothetical protein
MFKWASDPRTANLFYASTFVFIVSVVATIFYMLNGWGFSDAFYMTVITNFTVSYGEVGPGHTVKLRLVASFLIIVGCAGMIYFDRGRVS